MGATHTLSLRPHGPWPRLWHVALEYLLLLPVGAAMALLWANTAPESYFTTTFALEFLVNDVAMVLFFGLLMKEVAEATAPGGVLHPWRRAAMPLAAALGITIVPALLFAAVVPRFDEPRLLQGWPAILAVDLAAGYLLARLLFGRHAVIPFFVLLAICANALGVVATAAAAPVDPRGLGLGAVLMSAALVWSAAFRRMRLRSFWPYILVGGAMSWLALQVAGLEPALALVPIVPFLPHARRDPGFFVDADASARDALSRFELVCRHPAQAALFLFGLVNGGVPLNALEWGTLAYPIAALAGKPLGLMAGVGLAQLLGLHLPTDIGWRELAVVGLISAIGFTMALFLGGAALAPGPTLSALRMGALVCLVGAPAAWAAAALLRTGRFRR